MCAQGALLSPPDYGGNDYKIELQSATVRCPTEGCKGRCSITRPCEGRPQTDSGKYHNHCNKYHFTGKCIGDYCESHCDHSGDHFFAGLMGNYRCRCGGGEASDSEGEGEDADVGEGGALG